jgi:hypothetical protein
MPLAFVLAGGHVHRQSPEDEEDVLHSGEFAGTSVTTVLLSFVPPSWRRGCSTS